MLVYDGDCSFCTRSAHWVATRWNGDERTVAWQSMTADEFANANLSLGDVQKAVWWIAPDGRRSRGHLAIAHALRATRGWSSVLGVVILVPPFRWIAGAAYPLVARWRHRLPGGTPACRI